jgi:hypothetical protein
MYHFFLGLIQLPVPPSKMSIKISGKNKTIDLINEGEVNLIKSPGLTTISFSARLPNSSYPWANYDNSLLSAAGNALGKRFTGRNNLFSFKKAEFFLDKLENYKTTKQPFRFIVSRMGQGLNLLFSTNMLVTLESYTIEEDRRRDGQDVTVPLTLKQYRPFGTKTGTLTTDENGNQKFVVNQTRDYSDLSLPNAINVTNQMSIWEAVQGVANGNVDWREVMVKNGITNPLEDVRGKVIKL